MTTSQPVRWTHPAVSSTQPFADAAMALAQRGLAVIPCPGDDGKSPRGAIRGFHRWKRPPEPDRVLKMASQWGDANIGIVTSLSGVTVVDVDGGEALDEEMIARAGDTPLITRTPSLGYHHWYRSAGERNATLRSSGLAVDVKAVAAGVRFPKEDFRRDLIAYLKQQVGDQRYSAAPACSAISGRSPGSRPIAPR